MAMLGTADAGGVEGGPIAPGEHDRTLHPRRALQALQSTSAPQTIATIFDLSAAERLLAELHEHHAPSAQHSWRVAGIVLALAGRVPPMGFSLPDLVLAAMLHDIGKLHLPPDLLSSSAPLTAAQRKLVERHPVSGEWLLAAHGLPHAARRAALCHHEWWNGAGYPSGIARQFIPRVARIVAVADLFVATTEPGRGYRTPRTVADAMEELQAVSGTQLDPAAVTWLSHVAVSADLEAMVADPDFCRDAVRKFLRRFLSEAARPQAGALWRTPTTQRDAVGTLA